MSSGVLPAPAGEAASRGKDYEADESSSSRLARRAFEDVEIVVAQQPQPARGRWYGTASSEQPKPPPRQNV